MNTYIVRIYRRDEDSPDSLIGTIEDAGGLGEGGIFHGVQELWEFISSPLHPVPKSVNKPREKGK